MAAEMMSTGRRLLVWVLIVNWIHIFSTITETDASYLKDPRKCGKPTCNVDKKFGYTPNMIYTYKYTINVNTCFDGSDDSACSELLIDSVFELHFISSCEGVLVVTSATLLDDPDKFNYVESENSEIDGSGKDKISSQLLKALQEYPLRFYFDSGTVPEVCPHTDEVNWALNFKRGILSTLQNAMRRFDMDHKQSEIDVNGLCQTKYLFDSVNGTTLLIRKTKDMNSCRERHSLHSIVPTSLYTFQSKYHKWSPLLSNMSCDQYIDHKIYTEISCVERHSFEPFFNKNNVHKLSSTTVTNDILLISEEYSAYDTTDFELEDIITRRESLLFHHHLPLNLDATNVKKAENYIKNMCKLEEEEFNGDILEEYNRLIVVGRQLSYQNLKQLVTWSTTLCSTGKKHIHEALPRLQTSASIRVMRDIIIDGNEIPLTTAHEWLISMALFQRHDSETIKSISSLIHKDADKERLLAVSAMLYSYCRAPGIDCDNDAVVNDVTSFLISQVKNTCYNYKEFKKGIIGLKALGNIGAFTDEISVLLNECITKDSLPLEIRIAAVEAHRRFSCEYDRNLLLNVYQNQTYDTELRISAYLETLKCPTYSVIEKIKQSLLEEEVNQVGSFVWSHIKNLMKSSMDSALYIQAILQDENLSSKFSSDVTKYSQNYETSLYVNEYGTGGFLSSNVIFSHKSYIPRNLMMNFTVYLFGERINYLETSINLEGLEEYFEHLCKSGKLLPLNKIEIPLQILRFIRSTPSSFDEKIDAIRNIIKDQFINTKISAGFKIFGHELIYLEVDGKENFDSLLEKLNPLKIVKDFFSGKELKLDRLGMVLDSSYVTPLAVGLPLNIDATGTGALDINLAGFVNMTTFSSHGFLEFEGKFKPSVALNLIGRMGVSAFYKETNIKLKCKLLSSTALEGSFKMDGKKLVRIAFNLPKNKSDIFSVETEMITERGSKIIPIKGITADLDEKKICSWSELDEILGLKMCTNFLFPNATQVLLAPVMLLKGPVKFGISLEKSDPTAKKYILEYKKTEIDKDKIRMTATFETPESQVKRIMRAIIDLAGQNKNFTLLIESESNSLQAEGVFRDSPLDKSLNFGLDINGKKHVNIQLSLLSTPQKYGFTYEPKLLFAINEKRIADLAGSFRWVDKKNVSQCDVQVNFKTNKSEASLTGYVRMNRYSFATNLKILYKFDKSPQETLKLELQFRDRTTKFVTQFYGDVQLESTAYPEINVLMSLKYQKAHEHLECNIEMQSNPYKKDLKLQFYVQLMLSYLKTHGGSRMNTFIKYKKPFNDTDIKLGLSHEVLSGASNTAVMVRYASGKEIKITFDVKMPRGSMLYVEGKFRVTLPTAAEPMVIIAHIHEKLTNEYDIDFSGVWFSGHNITVKGMYTDRSTYATMNHNVKLLIKGHLFNDIIIMGRIYSSDEEYKIDVNVEHNSIKYVLILRHFYQRNILIETYGEVQYNSTSYILSNFIDLVKHKAQVELHLDKYRDIHLSVHGSNNITTVHFGFDVKWDANRDPTQKLLCLFNLNSAGNLNYRAKITTEYPGRVINAAVETQRKQKNIIGSASIDWSPQESIDLVVSLMWDLLDKGIDFKSTLSTPFEGWKSSSLTYGLYRLEYGIASNGSLNWMKDQSISVSLNTVYMVTDNLIDISFDAGLNSTTVQVKPMRAVFSHFQSNGKYETAVIMQTSVEHIVLFNSHGYINKTNNISDVCGSVKLKTPYAALSNAQLEVGIKLFVGGRLNSNVIFIFNDKEFSTLLKGSFEKLYESKLNFKIITPYEKYSKLYGRIGYSASNKHFIAQVKGPVTSSGIEILYVFNHFYNFDLKLHVFTGINFISDTIFVGKLTSDNADFRCGWNKLMVGIVGKAHYSQWKDMEYSAMIYLPVETLSKIGAVARLLYSDRIDLAATVIAGDKRMGLVIQAMRHPDYNFAQYKMTSMDEEMLFMQEYYFSGENFNSTNLKSSPSKEIVWRGIFELDSGFYNTSKGHMEISYEKVHHHSFYNITCDIDLPMISIQANDTLKMQNLINMSNELSLRTSNDIIQQLLLNYEGVGVVGDRLKSKLDGNISHFNQSHDFQLSVDYLYHSVNVASLPNGKGSSGHHQVSLFATMPFAAFNTCSVDFVFETDKNTYETDLKMQINQLQVDIGGILVIEDSDFLNCTFSLKAISPTINVPVFKVHFAKDFTEVEKRINALLILPGDDGLMSFSLGGSWLYGGPNYMKFVGHVRTPFEEVGISDINASFLYSFDNVGNDHFVDLFIKASAETEIKVEAQVHKYSVAVVKIFSTVKSLRNININGSVKDTGNGLYNFEAMLSDKNDLKLFGWFVTKPLTLELKVLKNNGKEELFSMSLNILKKDGRFEFASVIQQLEDKADVEGDFTVISSNAKSFNLKMSTTLTGYELLKLNGHMLSSDPRMTLIKVKGQTISEWLETHFEWKFSTWLDGKQGLIDTSLTSKQVDANARVEWVWKWMENIWSNVIASYTYDKITKNLHSKLHLWNPSGKFGHMSFGTDVSFNERSWWLSSNMSIVAPNNSDFAISLDASLPRNPEVYSLLVKLNHADNYSYFNHIIKYSTLITKNNYQFLSELKWENEIEGVIVAEVKSINSFYLLDRFKANAVTNYYNIRNTLKTNLMQKELITNVVYEKPSYHKIIVRLCYPPPVTIVSADIQFESTSNILANLNCTTPLENFSNATFILKAETDELKYNRFVKLGWQNKSALLNYTHLKTVQASTNISDGIILVDFPLTTRHIGKCIYQYEDTEKVSSGYSDLIYNGDTVMRAYYKKQSSHSHNPDSSQHIYDVQVDNSYGPIGLKYLHNLTYLEEGSYLPYKDIKRVEIFKLNNITQKFIGELQVHKSQNDENFKINAWHTIRKLSLVFIRSYKKTLETYGKLTLKPGVWAGYRLFLFRPDKFSSGGNNVELNVAYPKRNLSLFGDYEVDEKLLVTNVGIISNSTSRLYSRSDIKEMRAAFKWHLRESQYETLYRPPLHYMQLDIYHPSLKKNLTVTGEFSRSDHEFYNLVSTLEYSTDKKKKLYLSSVLADKSTQDSKLYTFEAQTTHPSSRLNLEMFGIYKYDSDIFQVVKNVSYNRSYLPLQYWNARVKVNKRSKELELERESLRDLASLKGKYFGKDGIYKINASVIKGKDIKISGCFDANIPDKTTQLTVNFTPDATERLHMDGFYKDNRYMSMKLWRVYDEDSVNDLSFYTRLNYSRMIQSSLVWRPDIKNDLSTSAQTSWNYAWNYVLQTFDFWTNYMKDEASDTVYDVWSDAKPILHDFIQDLRDLKNVQDDIDYFTAAFNESYNENEFYMQDAYNLYLFLAEEMSFRDKMGNLPKIFSELWEIMGETGETVRQSIVWLIENVKQLYSKVLNFFTSLMKGEVLTQISHFITKTAGKYDKVIKDVHVSFIGYVEYLWCEGATFLHNYWSKTLQVMEPTVIQLLHHLDSLVWDQSRKIFEFFDRSQQELLQSDYFAKNTNLTQDLEKFYKNITSNSLITNIKNYSEKLLGMINDKFFTNIPFGYELGEIGKEIYVEVLELYKLPLVNITIQTTHDIVDRVMLVYSSFDIGNRVQRLIPVVYRHLADISRNALNNNIKNHPSKTLFIFDPENGVVRLEQKLPMPWHSFNDTPNFSEIGEYKSLMNVQQLFSPSNITFWTIYYKYIPYMDPVNWIPPFKAHAIIIGTEHFITFNGLHFGYINDCSYLLAKDFVDNEFALILQYEPTMWYHLLVVVVGEDTISIDLLHDKVTISPNDTVALPADLGYAFVYHEFGLVKVVGKSGFTLECNLKHDVCTFYLEGWYFGKTAGLLGTMDSEPYNDFLSSDGHISTDLNQFAESWCVDMGCKSDGIIHTKELSEFTDEATCNSLFGEKSSEFSVCFPVIDPSPFNDICKYSKTVDDPVCSSSVAYNHACTLLNIPLRTPNVCVKCPTTNGTDVTLLEGEFTQMTDSAIPRSTDIIFIVEAQACNANLTVKRSFHTLVTLLEEELLQMNISDNRYALIAFGGQGMYSSPRTITVDNNEFSNSKIILKYFDHLSSSIGNGTADADIFSAISYATKQRFRPGVSKTFILVPCSDCDPRNMTLDYSVLHEVMTEKNAVLHILMNADFFFEKAKMSKIFYGVDADVAYTKNDFKAKKFKGDPDLRRQLKLTKATLGYCTPLALETNGTLFSAKKLEGDSTHLVKKFISVFARRVAKTAVPPSCQTCECTADQNGIDYVDCFPCFFPTPIYSDLGYYNDNFTLSFFPTFDQNIGGSETETDMDTEL